MLYVRLVARTDAAKRNSCPEPNMYDQLELEWHDAQRFPVSAHHAAYGAGMGTSGMPVSRTSSFQVVGASVAACGTPSVVMFHQQRLSRFVGAT
jgi:hypothetical protein